MSKQARQKQRRKKRKALRMSLLTSRRRKVTEDYEKESEQEEGTDREQLVQ